MGIMSVIILNLMINSEHYIFSVWNRFFIISYD